MKKVLIILVVLGLLALGWVKFVYKKNPAQQPSTASKSTPVTAAPAQDFDKQQFSTSDPASIWVIVNKQHPMNPANYTPSDLVAVGNGQYLRAQAATALQKVLADASIAGLSLTPASGYRSYSTQVAVYGREVAANGQAAADKVSARPGFSEHQTGLAMDFGSAGCSITDCFGQTAAGQWLAANAARYGFIMRYTGQNQAITGYQGESWHFRYVGKALAEQMQQQKTDSLEAFFGVSGGTGYIN